MCAFLFKRSRNHPDLHSFPTRRSSDLTLCLAVLPILTIPFLMGGVSWQESFLSVAFNLSSFCWALAAGLLASSWTKSWLRALFGAMLIAIIFGLSLGWLNCFLISSAVPSFA